MKTTRSIFRPAPLLLAAALASLTACKPRPGEPGGACLALAPVTTSAQRGERISFIVADMRSAIKHAQFGADADYDRCFANRVKAWDELLAKIDQQVSTPDLGALEIRVSGVKNLLVDLRDPAYRKNSVRAVEAKLDALEQANRQFP